MPKFFNPGLSYLTGLLTLLVLIILSPSGAIAGQFSVGVIEYNAKASQGGWTTKYGKPSPPLPLQIDLIADKINDTSNPSPVQFIALIQAGNDGTTSCPNDYLISCALAAKGLTGWKTIISVCKYDQTQLAYSSDWELVPNLRRNPLIDSYDRDVCWAELSPVNSDHGRPYNIAYFQNRTSKEMVLFVIVHMPHGQPDNCQGQPCPYGNGKLMWDVPQFKRDVRSVLGSRIDPKSVHLLVAGDMNDLGNDADPKQFVPIFADFGEVKISKQSKMPPDPTCCADNGYSTFFDRIVTNGSVEPSYEVVYLKGHDYPLDKLKIMPAKPGNKPKHNEEHKATYGVVKFD